LKQVDLGPCEYEERKPKGWRWKLPWSHPDDAKMQALYMVLAMGGLVYIFINRDAVSSGILFGITAVAAAVAGIMFALAFRDY
jgi:hypothetical protein